METLALNIVLVLGLANIIVYAKKCSLPPLELLDLTPHVTTCNIPRFYQILGEIFAFYFVMLIENSQGFKTF
jgi:hypothetical protein